MAPTVSPLFLWIGLVLLIGSCLAVDLFLHRKPRHVPLAEAARWTGVWVGLAALTGVAIWLLLGGHAALQFAASYAVEWSLSVDNVFVFVLLIGSLAVPPGLRYRVLFLGSLGAILLRLTFILAGSALINRFDWVQYVFGAILLLAAFRFLREPASDGSEEWGESGLTKLVRRWLPVSGTYDGGRLTTLLEGGRRVATPFLLALVLVAITDLVFAVDSVPAVFAMTRDPFIAVASNALAVIGLRTIYFLLEGVMLHFRFLKPALVALLTFIALKMLVVPIFDFEVPLLISLAAIVLTLGTAAVASWVLPAEPRPAPEN